MAVLGAIVLPRSAWSVQVREPKLLRHPRAIFSWPAAPDAASVLRRSSGLPVMSPPQRVLRGSFRTVLRVGWIRVGVDRGSVTPRRSGVDEVDGKVFMQGLSSSGGRLPRD